MPSEKFSIDEALGFGWKTTWANFLPYFGFWALGLAIYYGPMIVSGGIMAGFRITDSQWPMIPAALVALALGTIGGMGITRVMLNYCDGKSSTINDFFSPLPRIWKYLGATILYALIVYVGLILLIVPGIIWAIQFQFAPTAVIDRGLGPIEAMRLSASATAGVKWNLLGFALLTWLIQLGGYICLLIGIIPATMVTELAKTHIYRRCLVEGRAPEIIFTE